MAAPTLGTMARSYWQSRRARGRFARALRGATCIAAFLLGAGAIGHIHAAMGADRTSHYHFAAAPILGTLTVNAAAHGMVPLLVTASVDVDGTTTGGGLFIEGRLQWEIVNADGSPLTGDQVQECPRPTPRGGTVNLATEQEGFTFAYLITVPGGYKVRARFTNTGGESATLESSEITAAADTRTVLYLDGTDGNDSNNGSTMELAKKTSTAVISAMSGNNYKVIVKDGTPIAVAEGHPNTYATLNRSGVWWTRDYSGSVKPYVPSGGAGIRFANGSASGFVLEGIDHVLGGRALLFDAPTNAMSHFAAVDCEGRSALTASGNLTSVYLLRWTQTGEGVGSGSHTFYVEEVERVVMHGCVARLGSRNRIEPSFQDGEQVVRIPYFDTRNCNITFAWCSLGNPAQGGDTGGVKGHLRIYARRFVTIQECYLIDGGTGFCENLANTAIKYDYLCERCHWDMRWESNPTANTNSIQIHERAQRLMFRDCLMDREHDTNDPVVRFDGSGGHGWTDIYFENCTFKRHGSVRRIFEQITNSLGASVDGLRIRNCILAPASGATTGAVFQFTRNDDAFPNWLFANNVVTDYGSANAYFTRQVSSSTSTLDWAGFTGLGFVSGGVQETAAVGADGEPDGAALQTAGVPSGAAHMSLNGVEHDYGAESEYAGAWQPEPDEPPPEPPTTAKLGGVRGVVFAQQEIA